MTEREIVKAFRDYGDMFGALPLCTYGFNASSREKAARACVKAVDREKPFTLKELEALEPEQPERIVF